MSDIDHASLEARLRGTGLRLDAEAADRIEESDGNEKALRAESEGLRDRIIEQQNLIRELGIDRGVFQRRVGELERERAFAIEEAARQLADATKAAARIAALEEALRDVGRYLSGSGTRADHVVMASIENVLGKPDTASVDPDSSEAFDARVDAKYPAPQTYKVLGSLYEHECAYGCDSKWAVNCNCQGKCEKHEKALT